jgi:hypothetical protein
MNEINSLFSIHFNVKGLRKLNMVEKFTLADEPLFG